MHLAMEEAFHIRNLIHEHASREEIEHEKEILHFELKEASHDLWEAMLFSFI